LRENRVISGNWYNSPIFPLAWNELSSVGYVLGSCAIAESCCRRIFNLPTGINVSKEHAEKIADILNRSLES
jgi:dTDP-4-amino-4,6-dideoxygalactose transaminase